MSKDWDFSFEFDKSFIGIAVMLAIFPPIGLLMLLRRLRKFKRGRNEHRQFRNIGMTAMVCALFYAFFGLGGWGFVVFMIGLGLTIFSQKGNSREKRFRRYLSIIGGRSPMSLIEIAARANESVDTVEKDLEHMISQGYFGLTTYIDHSRGCIILDGVDDATWQTAGSSRVNVNVNVNVDPKSKTASSTTTYEEFKPAQPKVSTPPPKPQPEPAQATRPEKKNADQEDQFGRYLSEIRQLNDRIADPQISAKIDRIEGITSHIFEIVKKKPEKLTEIRKFMNYYLPTTLKLLDSYALLEEQGIEGDNISASKQQISQILDTLTKGFEKQLDQLFSTHAMDINSDIEVLENMMAVDGLKDSDFILKTSGGR